MDPTGGILTHVVEKVGEFIRSEVALLANTREDLKWLEAELRMMQGTLNDLDTRNIQDDRVKIWKEKLEQIASDANAVVDKISPHVPSDTSRCKYCLSCWNFSFKSRHDFGTEVANLRKRVEELGRLRRTYGVDFSNNMTIVNVVRTDMDPSGGILPNIDNNLRGATVNVERTGMDPSGGILSNIGNNLGGATVNEAPLLSDIQEDLELMRRKLRLMQADLDRADIMDIQDTRMIICIEVTRKLAFKIEDFIDTFSFVTDNDAASSSESSEFPTNFCAQMKQLKKEIDNSEEYRINIPDGMTSGTVDRTDELLEFRKIRAAPCIEDRDVVGLHRHIREVEGLLKSGGSRRSVVSIVGMGGLGKTTLAKKIYTNQVNSSSFECTAWICVSQNYSLPDLLRGIAREFLKLSRKDEQEMNQETMVKKLCDFLSLKKYLIVLDDVWRSELWHKLDKVLPEPCKGSRIIITTRKVEVAKSANPGMPPYELSALNEDESRILFTKKVFPDEENPEQRFTGELQSLRDKIVRKCGGLPLAIIVAGGLLSTREESPVEWAKVAEKIDWQETEEGEECVRMLALSYKNLPLHLRRCFLYLAAIPEDCEVSADHLKRLWIAEGFIEGASLEDAAESCLQELVQRCLIQLIVQRYPSIIFIEKVERVCRVHDLVLELATDEAKNTRFLDAWRHRLEGSPGVLSRRLSITAYENCEEMGASLESNNLRTLLIRNLGAWDPYRRSGAGLFNISWSSLKKNLMLVRVLDVAVYIHGMPEEIGEMVHLRYLALSGVDIKKLPESVGNLRHLQTLDVRRTSVSTLPTSIWQIKTLRYLLGSPITTFPRLKASLLDGTFKNLRVLHIRLNYETMTVLPYLTQLRELESYVSNVPPSLNLYQAIKKMESLHVLIVHGFSYSDTFRMDEIFSPTDRHEHLHSLELYHVNLRSSQLPRLPQSLKQVKLSFFELDHHTMESLGILGRLHRLDLCHMEHLMNRRFLDDRKMVFRTGWFPQLHVLHLNGLLIETWEVEERSLPLLRELVIKKCKNLKVLPQGLWQTLSVFTLSKGHPSLHERLQKPQDGRPEGEDWHKIKHIERVEIRP